MNFTKRLETYNNDSSLYTTKHKPWKLIMHLTFTNQTKAKEFEKYLKTQSGQAFAKKRFWKNIA